MMIGCYLVCILIFVWTCVHDAFLSRTISFSPSSLNRNGSSDKLALRDAINHHDFAIDIQNKMKKHLTNPSDIKYLTFSLAQHKPLGCSAEECLKVEEDGLKHVFVSSLVKDGNAEKAGIVVGDVFVGVSGSFSGLEDVFGAGLGRVRSLIAGRSENQSLELCVLRGSDILLKHESALIDLCMLPEDNDVIMSNCIKALYESSRDSLDTNVDGLSQDCNDQDVECMLDAMFRSWEEGDDLYDK